MIRELDGLAVSALGIGTYLGEVSDSLDASYVAAISAALDRGINLIDTAINYRCQRSERAVGQFLQRKFSTGELRREEVVICTKGGYVPFDREPPKSRAELLDYIERTFVDPGIARAEDFVEQQHCLAPGYIRHQFQASLDNLGLDGIDVYYLHNPESQLNSVRRENFTERMRAAFVELEGKVRRGQLRCYGTATWSGYRISPDRKNHLSLEALVDLAEECCGENHHFRVVQLPCSLAMSEAWTVETQELRGKRMTFMEAARKLAIRVVFSGSLSQGKLTFGLPEKVKKVLGGGTDAQRALRFATGVAGVSCALAGMARPEHVEENCRILYEPRADTSPLVEII